MILVCYDETLPTSYIFQKHIHHFGFWSVERTELGVASLLLLSCLLLGPFVPPPPPPIVLGVHYVTNTKSETWTHKTKIQCTETLFSLFAFTWPQARHVQKHRHHLSHDCCSLAPQVWKQSKKKDECVLMCEKNNAWKKRNCFCSIVCDVFKERVVQRSLQGTRIRSRNWSLP